MPKDAGILLGQSEVCQAKWSMKQIALAIGTLRPSVQSLPRYPPCLLAFARDPNLN